ncbi:MAG: TetR/AcrR family transcriptional regulator [Actinobacteria bacterium]|nr:TetR/AcrR family transcriptional regulator [Actinomycetota bacterium]
MTDVQTTKGAKRRAVIVATARNLLIDEGLDRFVLRRIADRTDMRLGNLQYYFATRDDLLEAIVRNEFSNDLAAMAQAANDDAATELTAVVALLSERWLVDVGSVYLPIGLLALHEPRFASVLAEIYQKFYDVIASLICRIDPNASPAQARLRALVITSLLDGASLQTHATRSQRTVRAVSREVSRLAIAIAHGQ